VTTVAEQLVEENRQRLRRMTPAARLAEALALGARAIEAFAAAHGIGRDQAARRLERASQAARRPSRVMREIVE